MWEGFAFSNQQAVESREAEERFARFLLGLEHQTPTQQAELIGALLAKAEQNNATKYKDKGTPCIVPVVTEWYARVSLANDCPWKGN